MRLGATIFLDASVLYPAPLRDLLMHVALGGLFRAKWSDKIHEEWINAVLRQRPDLRRSQLERTRDLMNRAVLDASVSDYESGAAKAHNLPDSGDVHVVAAAIKGGAEVILTFNLKHFPKRMLAPLDLLAVHPDPFLCELLEAAPEKMMQAMREHRENLRHPPKTAEEYLATLDAQGLGGFVKAVKALGIKI